MRVTDLLFVYVLLRDGFSLLDIGGDFILSG